MRDALGLRQIPDQQLTNVLDLLISKGDDYWAVTEPVTKAWTIYLTTEARNTVKIKAIEENWKDKGLLLVLELDKKFEQHLAYISQASSRYTIQEADELVGKLALRQIRSDLSGHSGAVKTTC